ncbi:hypothetical protein BST97_01090 [Nonlabens spongiae]|uniref:Uncharacterized protein n=1 Tax=Nonlabens spongiae TaxID=331648 RepID=A0A1W6MGK4_9FLAO|nr:hypothetical protein [Nonlabens spongiae]ARN76710.1 hypothetical protein BST97_01090 [Nonlabens spongiae]
MKELTFLLFILPCVAFAARKPINVTIHFEYDFEPSSNRTEFNIGNCPLDHCPRIDSLRSKYVFYRNYVILKVYDQTWKLHFNDGENLSIAIEEREGDYQITIKDGEAELKNKFLLLRHTFLMEQEKDAAFLMANKQMLSQKLNKFESMFMKKALEENLPSDFINDEKKFWHYYKLNFQIFYNHYKQGNLSMFEVDQEKLGREFELESANFYTPEYHRLAISYYTHQIRTAASLSKMKKIYREFQHTFIRWNIIAGIKYLIFNEPENLMYYRFLRWLDSYRYGDLRFLAKGEPLFKHLDSFPEISTKTLDGEKVDFKTILSDTTTYVFLYDIYDPNLALNLSKWIEFGQRKGFENLNMVTLGVNVFRKRLEFKSIFYENDVPGKHLQIDEKYANSFVKKNKIIHLPRIVQLNSLGEILNPDFQDQFLRRNQFDIYFDDRFKVFPLGSGEYRMY